MEYVGLTVLEWMVKTEAFFILHNLFYIKLKKLWPQSTYNGLYSYQEHQRTVSSTFIGLNNWI